MHTLDTVSLADLLIPEKGFACGVWNGRQNPTVPTHPVGAAVSQWAVSATAASNLIDETASSPLQYVQSAGECL